MVEVIGSIFKDRGEAGDFLWMIRQPEYDDALFIFNDNEEDHDTCFGGAGNAVVRRFNKHSKLPIPRSAGIPTGTLDDGGYVSLDEHAQLMIDGAVEEIHELLSKFAYRRVFFSMNKAGKLGTGIFDIGDDVRDYITERIRALDTKHLEHEQQEQEGEGDSPTEVPAAAEDEAASQEQEKDAQVSVLEAEGKGAEAEAEAAVVADV